MIHVIESDCLSVAVSTRGAELLSVKGKQRGTEFLWQGDAAFWPDRSPVLFPVVGRLSDDKYRYRGITYGMEIHGFAMKTEFTVIERSGSHIVLRMTHDDTSLRAYPFEFEFCVKYELTGGNALNEYRVRNAGGDDMYFSIGGHPGFNCPMRDSARFEDYKFVFNKKESADLILTNERIYFTEETKPFLRDEDTFGLSYDLFDGDALVFHNLKSDKIRLASDLGGPSVEVSFGGFPYLGIWTRRGAPYVCVEPWHGIGCYEGFDGELPDKQGIIKLGAGKEFDCAYTISVEE